MHPVLILHEEADEGELPDFTCGTISGNWCTFPKGYRCGTSLLPAPALCVNMVHNDLPGNGHFAAFLKQMEALCKDRGVDLLFLDVQALLAAHLVQKRGFERQPGSTHYRKTIAGH